jgi:cation:H+ antiporter
METLQIVLMLVVILVGAEIFTNALEHFGERLGISEGVTGSLFAAVATAMPESMVPLLALFAGTDNLTVNEEISVGAILGAPLMLSTLSLCLMSFSTLPQRGWRGWLQPERSGLTRDLNFFLLAFGIAACALFLPHQPQYFVIAHIVVGIVLVLTYFVYVLQTLRHSARLVQDGHGTEAHQPMLLSRLGLPENMFVISLQSLLGMGLLIAGAEGFIGCVERLSQQLGVSALLLSLLIIPIATELPEKVNSILWIRKRKDTLAFGNITGAMVFQGTILPAVGILLTPWHQRPEVLTGILITFIGALWLRLLIGRTQLRVWHLSVNGLLYLVYLYLSLR